MYVCPCTIHLSLFIQSPWLVLVVVVVTISMVTVSFCLEDEYGWCVGVLCDDDNNNNDYKFAYVCCWILIDIFFVVYLDRHFSLFLS